MSPSSPSTCRRGWSCQKRTARIIGHSAPYDIIGTFEIARKLVPKAKHVYILSGSHEVDKSFEDQARRELKKWQGELEFLLEQHALQ